MVPGMVLGMALLDELAVLVTSRRCILNYIMSLANYIIIVSIHIKVRAQ